MAIVLLAGILNFTGIDRTALWNDEAFSFFAARTDLAHAVRFIASDTQPPLYYLILNLWLGLGTTVFVIRALSATAMTLALLPLHATARRLFDERVALLASLLFAISPLSIYWAQKARPYPLQLLLLACAFWGFAGIYRSGHQLIGSGIVNAFRQRSMAPASVDLGWLAYSVCGALAMLTQAPAGFFLLGCNVAMAVSILGDLRRNRILLLNWVVAQLLLILIWMAWFPVFLQQISTHLTAEQIATKHAVFLVGPGDVLDTLQRLFAIAGLWRLGPVFVPLYVALACVGVVQIIRRRREAWPILAVIFVPVAVCVAGFVLLHPIFGYVIYTFIWILLPYSILIAFALLSLRPKSVGVAACAALLAGNLWGMKNIYQTDTPPLDRVAAVIRAGLMPGDGIVLSQSGSGRWAIAYYLGPPYDEISGLDPQHWGNEERMGAGAGQAHPRRLWVVVPDGEHPAVNVEAPPFGLRPAFTERVGGFQIARYE